MKTHISTNLLISLPAKHTCKEHSSVLVINQMLTEYMLYIIRILQHQLGVLAKTGTSASPILYSYSKRETLSIKIYFPSRMKCLYKSYFSTSSARMLTTSISRSPLTYEQLQICIFMSFLPHFLSLFPTYGLRNLFCTFQKWTALLQAKFIS